jgi:PPE-repeat protein
VAHFAWLPPEINSALIFAGAGAAPLLAAAAAWDGLAEDLASSATSFGSVASDLVANSWQGASSTAMMAVAAQYVGWLSAAAAQAEGAAGQAAATAAAFETALAATVQPAMVAANRNLVQVLASTNWFGLNAPAIMDTEAAYEQMWALDVSAMFGYYADASEAVSQLAPWQDVLKGAGFHVSNHGHVSVGGGPSPPSSGSGVNLGPGNVGNLNVGSGNTGSGNIGLGNLGFGNIGFGNTGNNDFGIGLTGNNQFGFGGFNSGSGNIGFGNSGTGNIGFFNSGNGNFGIGNSGSLNTGLANAGSVNTGFFNTGAANSGIFGIQANPEAAMLSSQYATGGLSAANMSSSFVNSAGAATGGFNPSMGSAGALSPAMANPAFTAPTAAAGVNSGTSNSMVSAASGPTPTAGLRAAVTDTAFFAQGNADAGLRTTSTRDSSIPNSNFFNKALREAVPDADLGQSLLSEYIRLPLLSD